jgi:hypothetical protein
MKRRPNPFKLDTTERGLGGERGPDGTIVAGCLLGLVFTLMVGAAALLGGCESQPVLKPVCPSLVAYSAADEKALRVELDANKATPEAHRWIEDYVGLRDQVRVCRKAGG